MNGPRRSGDDTYLTQDVRADALARYRVSLDPSQWGVAGCSSGGFCAANLALRHPGSFGAAAVIEGYFRAADGPGPCGALNQQPVPWKPPNSPLYLSAETAHPGQRPHSRRSGSRRRRAYKSDYRPATHVRGGA